MLFSLCLNKSLTASIAQFVRPLASDAFGSKLTPQSGHTHSKDFNCEIIYLG